MILAPPAAAAGGFVFPPAPTPSTIGGATSGAAGGGGTALSPHPPMGGRAVPPGTSSAAGGGGAPYVSGSVPAPSRVASPPRLFELVPAIFFIVHELHGSVAGGTPEAAGVKEANKSRQQSKTFFEQKEDALAFLSKKKKLVNLFK